MKISKKGKRKENIGKKNKEEIKDQLEGDQSREKEGKRDRKKGIINRS